MIVRQFLQWVRTASPGERAEAAGALARAFLFSEVSITDRIALEAAIVRLLDDASPLVRAALAETLASSADAPVAVMHGLAHDRADIAAVVLERSPLFIDAELVDFVATGGTEVQCAVARRPWLPATVAAAIVEVGCAEACLELIENPHAELAALSFDRLAERFGDLAAIREALFARDDLPMTVRQALVRTLSAALTRLAVGRAWLDTDHAERVAREACEKATIALAAAAPDAQAAALVRQLRLSGQLTAGLILRAVLSGNVTLFETALAELAELPLARVRALVHDASGLGLRAVFDRAGLPPSTYTALRHALEAWREGPDLDGTSRLQRRMVERVLTGCERAEIGELAPLMALLRRFAAEAAREEARACCDWLEDDDVELPAADEDERFAA